MHLHGIGSLVCRRRLSASQKFAIFITQSNLATLDRSGKIIQFLSRKLMKERNSHSANNIRAPDRKRILLHAERTHHRRREGEAHNNESVDKTKIKSNWQRRS